MPSTTHTDLRGKRTSSGAGYINYQQPQGAGNTEPLAGAKSPDLDKSPGSGSDLTMYMVHLENSSSYPVGQDFIKLQNNRGNTHPIDTTDDSTLVCIGGIRNHTSYVAGEDHGLFIDNLLNKEDIHTNLGQTKVIFEDE